MELIDVRHLGRERVIGCWRSADVLVDPGPESGCAALLDALDGFEPRAILLTHIHLDHAGATGALVRRWPGVEVCVHERGAPHLVDPSRLLASAARLYGEEMDRLWGEVAPVPRENVRALGGGETLHGFECAYTPGHASHHVAYLHRADGAAFVGDVAGVRIPPSRFVLPPTPPPDIDVELWLGSVAAVEQWRPRRLCLTHFGAVDDPPAHLEAMRKRLVELAARAREGDRLAFERRLRAEVEAALDPDAAAALLQAAPPDQHFPGLERYWRRRSA